MSVEVPLEIARISQISWTMMPYGTPVRPMVTETDIPEPSPVKEFSTSSPLQHRLATGTSDVFGDLIHQSKPPLGATPASNPDPACPRLVVKPESLQHPFGADPVIPATHPGSPHPRPTSIKSESSSQHLLSAVPVVDPSVLPLTQRSIGIFGQNIDIPTYDNEIRECDPSWPILSTHAWSIASR